MSQKISGVKGMNDLLPPTSAVWQYVEKKARQMFDSFGYLEIRTPVLEDTALFVRSVGEETDIVGKEMYTFQDKAGRSLSLRPEGTAPAVRAYIEHAVHNLEPLTRWFYLGPMFRYERMKTGRYRQFFQAGAEAYGAKEPAQDVELMDMAMQFFRAIELPGVSLEINSLGDDACRPAYLSALNAYFSGHSAQLCDDCRARLQRNPLRILDCKNPQCQQLAKGAPAMLDLLCPACRAHFDEVKAKLDALEIPYRVNPRIVRGLDYYTRTACGAGQQESGQGSDPLRGDRRPRLASGGDETDQRASPRGLRGGLRHPGWKPEEPDEEGGQERGAVCRRARGRRGLEGQGAAQTDAGRRAAIGGARRAELAAEEFGLIRMLRCSRF